MQAKKGLKEEAVMALADYIINKPVIETNRLVIRPLNSRDIKDLRGWTADNSIYTYWGKGPSKSDKDPSLLFEKVPKPSKSFHLGIEVREEKKVIGDLWVYLIENNRMASIAIRVGRIYQQNGYGTEALAAITRFCFENTELQRLQAQVDVRNAASIRMLEKCGYTREGLIRQGKMVSSWCDYYIYGILASDLQELYERVEKMEALYDQLSQALRNSEELNDSLKHALRRLSEYMDSGSWQRDYQLDEAGMIPDTIKRGVLSQDGLYDLLEEFE